MRGLYVITDSRRAAADDLLTRVRQAIAGGAAIVQYRDKTTDQQRRRVEARALAGLCRSQGVAFIINDDVELAAEVAADGVHLGQADTPLAAARQRLGSGAIIGVSCHNDLPLAKRAAQEGASYLAFGRFFPSASKPEAPAADIDILRRARQALDLPVVAIGGITPDNGAALVAAGADALAVIHGVFSRPDVAAAAREYASLFARAATCAHGTRN
jgi:thiamine-phosphate pyrophosphorylase